MKNFSKAIEELRAEGVHDDDIALYLMQESFDIFMADAPKSEKKLQFRAMASTIE